MPGHPTIFARRLRLIALLGPTLELALCTKALGVNVQQLTFVIWQIASVVVGVEKNLGISFLLGILCDLGSGRLCRRTG